MNEFADVFVVYAETELVGHAPTIEEAVGMCEQYRKIEADFPLSFAGKLLDTKYHPKPKRLVVIKAQAAEYAG